MDKLRKQTTIDNFKNLSLEEQCGVLLKVLNILTNKSYINNKDLEKIKEKVSHPKTSMILSSYESFKVINQSITGLFENVIDILG